MLKLLIAIVASLWIMCSWADTITVPNEFSADTTISSSQMNENFTALEEESNENDQRLDGAEASIDTLESYFPADSTATLSSGGWYTIAYLPGQAEGAAYFLLRNDTSGIRQVTVIYASIGYSRGGDVKVLQNRKYALQNSAGFTAVRIRKGDIYDGSLLQVQVTAQTIDQSVVARVIEREQSRDTAGWAVTTWVADGDPIDSVDYSLLTSDVTKSIPNQVQYLSDFDCTDGELLEWNDSTNEWQCATPQALPDAVLQPYWVDSNGVVAGLATYVDDDGPIYNFPESDRVFRDVYRVASGNPDYSGFEASVAYFESGDCSGTGYLKVANYSDLRDAKGALSTAVNPNTNKRMLPDMDAIIQWPDGTDFFSRSELSSEGVTSCVNLNSAGGFDGWYNDYVAPLFDSSVDVDLGITPPLHLEWR